MPYTRRQQEKIGFRFFLSVLHDQTSVKFDNGKHLQIKFKMLYPCPYINNKSFVPKALVISLIKGG